MSMTALFTRRDYEALPEGLPVQLVEGLLVKEPPPSFGHQRIQSLVLWELKKLLGPERVLAAPVGVLVDEINVFEPDVVVLETLPPDDAKYVGVPLLVCEILSPSTRARDRDVKTRRLLGLGVREVWLVDPDTRTIEIHDLDGSRLAEGDRPARSHAAKGFELVPAVLFR